MIDFISQIKPAFVRGTMRFTTRTDLLTPFGFPQGTEVDFVLLEGDCLRPGVYLVHLMDTKRYFVRRVTLHHIHGTIKLGRERFAWSQVRVIGEYRKTAGATPTARTVRAFYASLNTVAAVFLAAESLAIVAGFL